MENQDIAALMTQYLELKTQAAQLDADKRKLMQDAMPPEVRQRVEEIEAEFAGKGEQAEAALTELEEKIKDAVVSARSNVAVDGMKASFYAGRVTWDSKGLEDAMSTNPQVAEAIAQYKKQGKEYASFTFPKA
ncbi:MAG TPA: hypothetical protein PLC52_02170 [Anaerolineales bacterium]|nr:hypothetical protein [Anaerolineales bacterium]HRQ91660.1 hypothetical protein [Anaerolineales bacterium]